MEPRFRAQVVGLVDFDYDDPKPGFERCVEVTVKNVRGLMYLGEIVVLKDEDGTVRALTLKGAAMEEDRAPSLNTGEVPVLLEKPSDLAAVRLTFEPGMALESGWNDRYEE